MRFNKCYENTVKICRVQSQKLPFSWISGQAIPLLKMIKLEEETRLTLSVDYGLPGT